MNAPPFPTPAIMLPAIETEPGRWWPTTGDRACEWIERYLVHGEGDFYGLPFRLRPWQRLVIYRLFEYDPISGKRRFARLLLGLPKGNGKTELLAAIALYLLLGDDPLSEGTPDIPVAAASFEQADLLFSTCKTIVTHPDCPLGAFVDAFDTEILRKDQPGSIYRVAAAAGTNDGRKPSAYLGDEYHEWTGRKVRVHTVLENGLSKRSNTIGLYITTAGAVGAASVAEDLYQRALKIASGDFTDPRLLVIWWAAPDHLDLDDPDQLLEAIRTANPAADDFWPADRLVQKWQTREIPEFEFRRYHLNQWTAADTNPFLPPGQFGRLPHRDPAPAGTAIWAFFDGSYKRDASALWAVWKPQPGRIALFRVGLWEKPDQAPDTWQVDRRNVDARVAEMFRTWRVQLFGLDPYGWHDEADRWAETYGDDVVVEVPTNQIKRWSEYCDRFRVAVVTGTLEHDHDGACGRHLNNCVPRETAAGTYVVKERRSSPRKIDAAICAIGAHGLATDADLIPTPRPEPSARWI